MKQDVQQILEGVLAEGQNVLTKSKVADYIPGLTKAGSSNLGCCTMSADDSIYKAKDYNIPFTMQSTTETLSLILMPQTSGYDHTLSKVSMELTGDRFDSILQLKLKDWRPFNPMISAGTIVTADCIVTTDPFGESLTLIRKLCGDPKIQLNEEVHHSEKRTGTRDRSIAYLLRSDHMLDDEPEGMLDVYFRMCSVMCTAKDLAHYAMILPNKGVDPKTGECLLDADIVRIVTMFTMLYSMYDESGEYVVRVGPPLKSGVGGGIVTVGQSDMGIGTLEPMLNKKGSSVGDERILQYLLEHLSYHIFA